MAGPNTSIGRDGGSLSQGSSAKRRKVRKGTRSCWECKRRKIKCIFASANDNTCVFCFRRRTSCVSQELPEELSPARKSNRFLGDRISRVEDLMKEVLASKDIDATDHAGAQSSPERRSRYGHSTGRPNHTRLTTTETPQARQESLEDATPESSLPTAEEQGSPGPADNEAVLHHLFEAFPCKEDTKILLRESTRWARYNYIISTQPSSELTFAALATPQAATPIPSHNSHPITVAQCMLIMAITLQIPQKEIFSCLSESRDTIMHRLVNSAATWVTNRQEMHETIEFLLCIMLEGMFETNCGNLRHAWTVYRKAMTVAQLMGLHRSPTPALKRLDPKLDADPEAMWFRIIYMDRYLSLLLGLPQGTSDRRMCSPTVLETEAPLGKFERLLTVVASDILNRNERTFTPNELTKTLEIDAKLLKVSKSVPASFLRSPDFHGLTPGEPEACVRTPQVGVQVYYYGLLLQLHIPYMMQIGGNISHDYSKITCVNAGREILSRYISHRSFNPISSCSRPVDFYALLAAITLLLAHLDAHHHQAATNYLAHSRLSDRDMLEQVLERMDIMSSVNGDALSARSAVVIRRFLEVEEDAARGANYTARSAAGDEIMQEGKEGEELHLYIPYLGTIKITRQEPNSQDTSHGYIAPRMNGGPQPGSSLLPSVNNWFSFSPNIPLTDGQSHSLLQEGIEELNFTNNGAPSGHPNLSLEAEDYGSNIDNPALQPLERLSPVAMAVDDWVFQGVDLAFFDSLMKGMSPIENGNGEQQWGQ